MLNKHSETRSLEVERDKGQRYGEEARLVFGNMLQMWAMQRLI